MSRSSGPPNREPPLIATLRRSIETSGLSISELARQSGVSQPQLSRFVNGQRTLTLQTAAKLFELLNLQVIQTAPPATKRAAEEPTAKPAKRRGKS
jgi:transcriptional regulator with XRE-family HTH domain